MKEWTIQESHNAQGTTDHYLRIITAPTVSGPTGLAIRLHEALHATTSEPKKPDKNREAFEWLEEARIDYIVDDISKAARKGIRIHRQVDVDKWLSWGAKWNERMCAKTAIIGRGYRLNHIFENKPEDQRFIANILGQLSANPPHEELLRLAATVDEKYP